MKSLAGSLLGREEIAELDGPERRLALREVPGLDAARVADHADGLGPLTALMDDHDVTDVLVNGPREVWIERSGNLELTEVVFDDTDHLVDLLHHVFARAGSRVDFSRPGRGHPPPGRIATARRPASHRSERSCRVHPARN